MVCPACGTTCPAAARHCPGCGIRLDDAAAHDAGTRAPSYVAPIAIPSANAAAAPLLPGTLLNGRYCVEEVLGAGAFGRVYRARDTQDPGAPVLAIKELLDAGFASPEEKHEAIAWFKREVSALLTLEHPGIPAIYGYWTAHAASGPFYLAMEYVPGQTLEQVLVAAGGRVAWPLAAEWGIALCEVLAYLHSRVPPFIFRDLKLPNVLLDSRANRPVLIDFGIARQLAAAGGTAIGTWGYVPYEQVLGRAEPRSDLYALGATLHALLTGRRPDAEYARLQREGRDVEGAMRALFPPVTTLVPETPAALSEAIARATAFDARDRFPTVAAMATALAAALGRADAITLPLPAVAPETDAPGVGAALAASTPSAPYTLTVSKLGRGAFASIGEALRAAPPGSRIEVQPGLYAESLVIDKPLEIVGAGRVDDIIVEASAAPCLTMHADNAVVRGLTLRGRAGSGGGAHVAVDIPCGRLVLEDCRIASDSLACVAIHGVATDPVIRRCAIHDGRHAGIMVHDNARGTIEECDIARHGMAGIEIGEGADPTIRNCAVHGGQDAGIFVLDGGRGVVEDCDIYGNTLMGVAIKEGGRPLVRRCAIHDGRHIGLLVYEDGQGVVEDCDVYGNMRAGVGIMRGGAPVVRHCTIRDGSQDGVFIYEGGRGTVEDCDIVRNAKAGVEITQESDPVIRHCKIRAGQSVGVLVDMQGRGTIDDCNIVGNALAGVEVREGGAPLVTQCRINNNGLVGVWVHSRGSGAVENCDVRGNHHGPWRIGFLCWLTRRGNRG